MTDETRKAVIADIADFLRKNIEDYDVRVEFALTMAERRHTMFEMETDYSLVTEMRELITEWLENEFSLEEIASYDNN